MSFLRSFLISSLGTVSGAALAQQLDDKTDISLSLSKPLVSFMGTIQSKYSLYNTASSIEPSINISKLYLGAKFTEGIASGIVDLSLINPIDNANGTGTIKKESHGLRIRQAEAQLNLMADGYASTLLRFGAIRLGGAQTWGMGNVEYQTTGYDRTDGIAVQENIDSELVDLSVGVGVFNNLPLGNNEGGILNSPAIAGKSSINKDKAIIGNVNASIAAGPGSIEASGYFGTQKNAPISYDTTGTQPRLAQVADATHIEASLGYNLGERNDPYFGFGGWYEMNIASYGLATYTDADKPESFSVKKGPAATSVGSVEKATFTHYGFGVSGHTSPFLTNILQKGDTLFYGASVDFFTVKTDRKDEFDDGDFARQEFILGAGYQTGSFSAELDFIQKNAKSKQFGNNSGVANKEKAATEVVLVAQYKF